uniref:Serine hydrolase-like protein n=1 Tax=Cacopsylla melanoneura TaxID=428564 RepID=A0A8D8YV86_9HEMI
MPISSARTVYSLKQSMNVSEIKIPVPWGHIAGKTWGKGSNPPVLCLHGILDNCNTFDRLIPLLPTCFFYICIDFPSHGLSSHIPPGFMDSGMVFVSSIERVAQHLRLDRFIIMGHSFGGRTGVFYTSLFPEKVEKLIMLDTWGFKYYAHHETQSLFRNNVLIPFKIEAVAAKKTQPKYSYETLLQRVIAGRSQQDSSFKREAAEIILARHIRKVPGEDKYYYTPDQHLKHYEHFKPILTLEQYKHLYSRYVRCKVLVLESTESDHKHNSPNMRDIRAVWKQLGAEIHRVEGNHDVHINEPERVAPLVEKFLLEPSFENVGRSKL